MISFLQPLPVGNAVRVILAPPAGALIWRVLRKATDDIADQDDPAALLVYEGADPAVVDIANLANGTPYHYQPFYRFLDGTWGTSISQAATPAAIATLVGPDPLELVRQRLEVGLKAAVANGQVQHKLAYIPTFTAPPTFEGTAFPIVTVHLSDQSPSVRGLGELVLADEQDPFTGDWTETEGWLTSVRINIVSWIVGNADARIALRKAIAAILLGNLPVFNDAGLTQIEFTQSDVEDMESYNAPVYQTITSFSALALLAVDAVTPPIVDVSLAAADLVGDLLEAEGLSPAIFIAEALLDFSNPDNAVVGTL